MTSVAAQSSKSGIIFIAGPPSWPFPFRAIIANAKRQTRNDSWIKGARNSAVLALIGFPIAGRNAADSSE
jgi:hypothetical protein